MGKYDNLSTNEFGIPEDRKFPLDTKEHVQSAMKLFGHAEESKKKELAKRIASKAKKYDLGLTPMVRQYLGEEAVVHEGMVGELVVVDPDKPKEEVEYWYQKYSELPMRLRRWSNDEAVRQYGLTNDDLYTLARRTWDEYDAAKNLEDPDDKAADEFDTDVYDFSDYKDIENYADTIKENQDILSRLKNKLDLCVMANSTNLVESVTSSCELIDINNDPDLAINDKIPPETPYFTPDEMSDMLGNVDDDFFLKYKNACSHGLCDFKYADTFNDVRKVYREYRETHDEKLAEQLIRLGWNPAVEPTIENMKFARKRITKYIGEKYNVRMVDVSNMSVQESATGRNGIHPIFIVLSWTGSPFGQIVRKLTAATYTHAGISLDVNLNKIYTFLRQTDGFDIDSLQGYEKRNPNSSIKVMCVFVTTEQYDAIAKTLAEFKKNKELTSYNMMGCIDLLFSYDPRNTSSTKMICSQFVEYILRVANVNITGAKTTLVSPNMYDKVNNPYVYILYQGYAKDYKPQKIQRVVNALATPDSVYKTMTTESARDYLFKYNDVLLYKMIGISESNGEAIMEDIRKCLTASSILTEKAAPISLRKDDGMIQIHISDYESEYQRIHKELDAYDRNNNLDGIKDCLAQLWSLNTQLSKRIRGFSIRDKKKLGDCRARVLNDFSRYMDIVVSKDPQFNFSEYYNQSRYCDHVHDVIDINTLKWVISNNKRV